MGDGKIVVSDAHTGRLTVLNASDLSLIRTFGGNGPGYFNMPYGVESAEGRLWVASVFNKTLVELAELSWETAQRYPAEPWRWRASSRQPSDQINGEDYEQYASKETVTIRDHCYRPAYASLRSCTDEDPDLPFPRIVAEAYMYFTQAIRLPTGVLITSPQNAHGVFYSDEEHEPVHVHVGLDTWVVDAQLIGPSGVRAVPEIEKSRQSVRGSRPSLERILKSD